MSISRQTLPPALPSLSCPGRERGPLTIDQLAHALRGMPRDATFWVSANASLHPVVAVAPSRIREDAGGPTVSTVGDYAWVLLLGGMQ